ncbi:c-type cytochrome biogenesis protein CcsB [Planktothrix paucivesiculata]|uniref:Cytochrome c biogenesis protein CcsA n=1 Tax=Planktothrix paucivesiculata PCC 9631 TaxID=671071 RepID=A0A7Z9BVF6_9CYAN|nr:c-type cytochrome biogenesis protein CcsB [Planktothrix paucivesiculata]VXD19266.1 Cytochrome c biogenesis protein CcsA [Planktothrix paucivesiculata PCC 9631]
MNLVVLQNGLDNISFAILLITLLLYWVGAAFPNLPYLSVLGTAGMAIANLSIAALLGARWIEAGYFPISNLYESLFFLTWGLTTIHLIAEQMSRSRLVGVVTSPVAMGIAAFATLKLPAQMRVAEPLVPALKSNWLMMHVSVMMLSYATLMVGSLLAIAFLILTRGQEIELSGSSLGTRISRNHQKPVSKIINYAPEILAESHPKGLTTNGNSTTAVLEFVKTDNLESATLLSPQRLTLVETIDNISYRIIGLGFPLLTIGIISGAVWANEAWGSYWSWDPKETWALITWLVFAAYLHARITRGWQGRKPAILAATGFVVVWVCYLGVNLLGKGLHSYGWFF